MVARVLITGAAGDIGLAIARRFAARGATLILADNNAEKLNAVADGFHDTAVAVALNVASAPDWQQMAALHEVRFSELEAAVFCAGIEGPIGQLETIADDGFDAVMEVNVRGVWLGLKTCLPPMKARRVGSIVVLSSISGRMGAPFLAPYAASKHAVLGLVRSAARETAAHGVRVNAIAPGPVKSDMMHRIDARLRAADPDRFGDAGNAARAMSRYVTPDDVAAVAEFLCSEAAHGCTGGVYAVDGAIAAF